MIWRDLHRYICTLRNSLLTNIRSTFKLCCLFSAMLLSLLFLITYCETFPGFCQLVYFHAASFNHCIKLTSLQPRAEHDGSVEQSCMTFLKNPSHSAVSYNDSEGQMISGKLDDFDKQNCHLSNFTFCLFFTVVWGYCTHTS